MKFLVNLITLTRLLSSIALIHLIDKISNISFIIIAIIIFLTDSIDGFLARKFHVQTYFGSLLDAIADKTLCICLIIPLIKITKYTYFILIMEIVIAIINAIGKLTKRYIKSLYIGKIKMWIISLSIVLGYLTLFYKINSTILVVSLGITFGIQFVTIISYLKFINNQKSIKEPQKYKLSYKLFNTEYYLNKEKNL